MKETKFYKFKYAVIQDDGYSYDAEKIIEETTLIKAQNHLKNTTRGRLIITQIIDLN